MRQKSETTIVYTLGGKLAEKHRVGYTKYSAIKWAEGMWSRAQKQKLHCQCDLSKLKFVVLFSILEH